jgi:hypothetical protein
MRSLTSHHVALKLLQGEFKDGGTVLVSVNGNKEFSYSKA